MVLEIGDIRADANPSARAGAAIRNHQPAAIAERLFERLAKFFTPAQPLADPDTAIPIGNMILAPGSPMPDQRLECRAWHQHVGGKRVDLAVFPVTADQPVILVIEDEAFIDVLDGLIQLPPGCAGFTACRHCLLQMEARPTLRAEQRDNHTRTDQQEGCNKQGEFTLDFLLGGGNCLPLSAIRRKRRNGNGPQRGEMLRDPGADGHQPLAAVSGEKLRLHCLQIDEKRLHRALKIRARAQRFGQNAGLIERNTAPENVETFLQPVARFLAAILGRIDNCGKEGVQLHLVLSGSPEDVFGNRVVEPLFNRDIAVQGQRCHHNEQRKQGRDQHAHPGIGPTVIDTHKPILPGGCQGGLLDIQCAQLPDPLEIVLFILEFREGVTRIDDPDRSAITPTQLGPIRLEREEHGVFAQFSGFKVNRVIVDGCGFDLRPCRADRFEKLDGWHTFKRRCAIGPGMGGLDLRQPQRRQHLAIEIRPAWRVGSGDLARHGQDDLALGLRQIIGLPIGKAGEQKKRGQGRADGIDTIEHRKGPQSGIAGKPMQSMFSQALTARRAMKAPDFCDIYSINS